jgi:hypothetical protein
MMVDVLLTLTASFPHFDPTNLFCALFLQQQCPPADQRAPAVARKASARLVTELGARLTGRRPVAQAHLDAGGRVMPKPIQSPTMKILRKTACQPLARLRRGGEFHLRHPARQLTEVLQRAARPQDSRKQWNTRWPRWPRWSRTSLTIARSRSSS